MKRLSIKIEIPKEWEWLRNVSAQKRAKIFRHALSKLSLEEALEVAGIPTILSDSENRNSRRKEPEEPGEKMGTGEEKKFFPNKLEW